MLDKTKRGGKREGAGRPPLHKKRRTVALSPEVWRFIAVYALQMECSENEAIERLMRSHLLYKDPLDVT